MEKRKKLPQMNTACMSVGQLNDSFRGEGKVIYLASYHDELMKLVKHTNVLRSYSGVLSLPVMELAIKDECSLIAKVDFPAAALGNLIEEC